MLTVAASICLPLLGWRTVVGPYVRASDSRRSQLASQQDQLSRELTLLADTANVARALRRTQVDLRRNAALLLPSDIERAGEALSFALLALVKDARLTLEGYERLDSDTATRSLTGVDIQLRVSGSWEDLVTFVQLLDNDEKLLSIKALSITSAGGTPGDTRESTASSLSVSMRIRGFARSLVAHEPLARAVLTGRVIP